MPFAIMFRIFFAYSCAIISSAFFISTVITKQDQANKISFSVILTVILIGVIFSEPRGCLGVFRNERTQDIFFIWLTNAILELIPTYCFSLGFGITARIATRHIPLATNKWEDGAPYTWDDYYSSDVIKIKITDERLDVPPVAYYVYRIWVSFYINVFLFWYLDHILASNRGVAHSLFFPF